MSITNEKQPDPVPSQAVSTWEKVIEDYEKIASDEITKKEMIQLMVDRNNFGIKKYNTPIQPFNGRDNLGDCLQEMFDAVVYIKNEHLEKDNKVVEELYKSILDMTEITYLLWKKRKESKNEGI